MNVPHADSNESMGFDPAYVQLLVDELKERNPDAVNPKEFTVRLRNAAGLAEEVAMLDFAFFVRALELKGRAMLSPYGGGLVFICDDDCEEARTVIIPPLAQQAWWTAHYCAVIAMGNND